MFNLASALLRRNGEYTFDQLQEILRQIRREHLDEISPEIGVADLLSIAQQKNWIREDETGNFHIDVSRAA